MKTMLIMAVVGLLGAVVSAHGGGGGGGRSRDRDGGYGYNCVCGTQCAGNTGTKKYACRKSSTSYLQCAETACTIQTCGTNELFNATSGACQACATGQHIDASGRRCVCNQGSTWDSITQSCSGKCPDGSTQSADRCDCVYPQVVNKSANACQNCPTGTTRSGKGCACTDRKQFWNAAIFTCQGCPGSWVPVTIPSRRGQITKEVCQCPTATDAFNKRTVACVTCPNGSTVNNEGCRVCTCTDPTMGYNEVTNTCVPKATLERDSSSHP